jgi:DNA-binding transcriptional LysR family regulator
MTEDLLARLDWTLVRSFLAVVDAGSVTAAARQTRAHQPTLSRHIAELEAQLGAPLFERTGRGVLPTAAAQAVLPAARRMQEGAQALAQAVRRGREATRGTVRITTSEVAASWLLPPLVAALQQEEPGIAIEIVASNAVQNLLRREADIALRMVRPAQQALVARKLGEIAIGAWADAGYLARAGTPRTPADLLHHRLVGYDRDPTLRQGFARLAAPVEASAFALRTDNQLAYLQLVAAGGGIGFVADYCARQFPGLRPVLAGLPIPPLPCWLAVHRELRSSGVVRRVFDFLAEAVPARLAAMDGRGGPTALAKA